MNLLLLTHDALDQSAFRRAFSLAAALAGRGHRLTLLAARTGGGWSWQAEEREGVRLLAAADVFPRRVREGGFSPQDALGRMRRALAERWDVVHAFTHRPGAAGPAWLAARRSGAPLVFDWSDVWGFSGIAGWRRGLERWLLGGMDHAGERGMLALADGVTVVNSELFGRARRYLTAAELLLVPPGADIQTIRPRHRNDFRARYGLQPEDFVLVHSSQSPFDAELLVQTFQEIRRRLPSARLLLTGRRYEGVLAQLADLGLAADVRYPGFLPYAELGGALACGDVMFLPYAPQRLNLQRSPSKLGDYLAAGRPVVTNPTGGMGELVRRGEFGLAVEATPAACADAILALYRNPARRAEMGRRARLCAVEVLDWSRQAEKLEGFYERLLERRRAR